MYKCRKCEKTKDFNSFYKNKRTTIGYDHLCKECKKIDVTCRRYKISEDFYNYLYSHYNCMCCESKLDHCKLTHIHHTDSGVKGILCYSCNYVLGQEAENDLEKIKACLKFMRSKRKNLLDRDNQQERLNSNSGTEAIVESPETTRCESQMCKQCDRKLPLDYFTDLKGRNRRKICNNCRYKNDKFLRKNDHLKENETHCHCCKEEFTLNTKVCLHHIGDEILGIVCSRCNQLLGDESKERRNQLLCCMLWIEDSLEHKFGIMI